MHKRISNPSMPYLNSAGNVWAANGIGAVLAERGSLTDAHAVLAQVQDGAAAAEALLPMPDVLLNMANLQLAQQDYYSAIQMYTATLRRFHAFVFQCRNIGRWLNSRPTSAS